MLAEGEISPGIRKGILVDSEGRVILGSSSAGGTGSPSSDLMGSVASVSSLVTSSFTRPANTTAYAAKTIISSGSVLNFANLARVNAGSGTIVKARLLTSQAANVARHRLHLFISAPTLIADGGAATLLYTDAASRVGIIEFPACAMGGTGSTAAGAMRPSPEGGFPVPNLMFKCAAASRALHYLLETVDAYTPDSGQQYFLELMADGLS